MSNYTTGELARLCGVSVRTVQYYDTRGVLSPTELSEGGRRIYTDEDLKKMRSVCFLRELGIPLGRIADIMREENAEEVIGAILSEQKKRLVSEMEEIQSRLDMLEGAERLLSSAECVSVESIADVAHIMENKKKLQKVHKTMLLTGIPLSVYQIVSIVLWITHGFGWLFAIWGAIAVPYGIVISLYYFRRVSYVCPSCHEVFVPKFKEAFFAAHTPYTRKLTCPKCGHRGYCVETYRAER